MNTQKYIDIAYQNPRGKLATAILVANLDDWNYVWDHEPFTKLTAEQVIIRTIWGFGVEGKRPPIKGCPEMVFDEWFEQTLTKYAYSPSTKFVASRNPKKF